jgi:hypothetical protein
MVITERYLRMTLIRRYLGTINRLTSHIDSINILRMLKLLCALSRMDDTVCLDICFLPCRGSPRSNTLAVGDGADGLVSAGGHVGVRVEVVPSSGERRESVLAGVVGFEGFVDVR